MLVSNYNKINMKTNVMFQWCTNMINVFDFHVGNDIKKSQWWGIRY